MKTTNQPTLPGVRDWREPQIISAQQLARTITEANSAGFEAIRLETWKRPFGYRVTFQRMADASEGRGARPADGLQRAQNQTTGAAAVTADAGCPPEKKWEPYKFRPSSKVKLHS